MATATTMRLGLPRRAAEQHTAAGQQAAFEALIDESWEALWRYAYRTAGSRDDAEDLMSEALIEGFRSFHQFRGETLFVRWMYRVMTTTRIDMVRRARRHTAESLDDGDGHGGGEIADESADPVRLVVDNSLSEEVQGALMALPEEFRAVVVLADMEQMDYADVSRALGIPIGTVRSRLHRGRNQLRRALAAHVTRP